MARSGHESSQELKIFQVISTSLMTPVYPSGYKVIGQCQHAIQAAPLLIIALPQAASHPIPSTGSKRPICQMRQLQLNRHKGRGTSHAHLGTRWEKEYTAGSLWASPHIVRPGSLFVSLWGSSVVQRELGPLRIRLELSFLLGRDRPSCAKLLGNKPSCVVGAPAPVRPRYAAGWCLAGSL